MWKTSQRTLSAKPGGGGLWTNGRVQVNATRRDTPNAPFRHNRGRGLWTNGHVQVNATLPTLSAISRIPSIRDRSKRSHA